jgi:hypothetical protein
MRKEKVDLENTLEFEQEAMVNRLQKRLEQLELERTYVVDAGHSVCFLVS